MNFRTTKYALLFGAINGIVFFLVYQPVKIAFVKYLWYTKNDNYVYVVLPQMYRIAHDVGEIFIWTALFTLASYSVHRFWANKLKSTVSMWLRIGLVSLGIPILGLWLLPPLILLLVLVLRMFDVCFYPLNCDFAVENPSYMILRQPVDIKFELLLLIVAVIVNFIYSAVLAKLQKRFEK